MSYSFSKIILFYKFQLRKLLANGKAERTANLLTKLVDAEMDNSFIRESVRMEQLIFVKPRRLSDIMNAILNASPFHQTLSLGLKVVLS